MLAKLGARQVSGRRGTANFDAAPYTGLHLSKGQVHRKEGAPAKGSLDRNPRGRASRAADQETRGEEGRLIERHVDRGIRGLAERVADHIADDADDQARLFASRSHASTKRAVSSEGDARERPVDHANRGA